MSFPPYPRYTPSGFEWLEEVPQHWGIYKIGNISLLKGRLGWQGLKSDEYRDIGPYVVSSAHFLNNRILWDECPRVSQERYNIDTNIQLAIDDLLLMKDGAAMGKLAFVDSLPGPACLNSHLLLFRPVIISEVLSYCPKFMFYFMQTKHFQEHIKVHGTGATFLGVSQETISRYKIALPTLEEQFSIASFLDHETAKINALVEEQKRLIELLTEKRQAIITHAVTKGLNPNAPMKPSGIEWLGDVPEHWETRKFSRIVTVAEGLVDPQEIGFTEMILIAPNHVESGTGKLIELETAADQAAESGKYLCRSGDVIYSKIRPALAKVTIAPYDCLCSADMYPLCGFNEMQNHYLRWLLLSKNFTAWSILKADRVAMPKINRETLADLHLPLPPVPEQEEISKHIENVAAQQDDLIDEAALHVELLEERRSALISAAVTGKIDVREANSTAEAA